MEGGKRERTVARNEWRRERRKKGGIYRHMDEYKREVVLPLIFSSWKIFVD